MMINIKECATLCFHTYHPHYRNVYGTEIFEYKQNRPKSNHPIPSKGFAMITDVDDYSNPAKPVYVQLYVKFSNGKATDAVIAIRGTVPSKIGNDVVDAVSWFSDVFAEGSGDKISVYCSHIYHGNKSFSLCSIY